MATGWFGAHARRATKVHYVLGSQYPKPICGARIHPHSYFQFCAAGFEERYVECERCKQMGRTPPMIKIRREGSP